MRRGPASGYHRLVARSIGTRLTYEDYAAIPSDGRIYQIVDGEVIVTPAPSPHHQRASRRLQRQLEDHFHPAGRAEVFNAPIDLILTQHDVTQPDLMVVADAASVSRRGIEAAPLLIVEVLSPSTERYDRQVKARRYAALGVPHYWVLDPETRRLECYVNQDGVFQPAAVAEGDAPLTPPGFDGLTVDLAALWRADHA
jgi:Uma2 family endonuclease